MSRKKARAAHNSMLGVVVGLLLGLMTGDVMVNDGKQGEPPLVLGGLARRRKNMKKIGLCMDKVDQGSVALNPDDCREEKEGENEENLRAWSRAQGLPSP